MASVVNIGFNRQRKIKEVNHGLHGETRNGHGSKSVSYVVNIGLLVYYFTGVISITRNESGFVVRLGRGLSAVAAGAGLNSAVGI